MSVPITIRPGTLADGPVLQDVERAAGERFREVGMDAIADDAPFSLDELGAYVAAGRSWVAVDPADRAYGYIVVDEVDGFAHVEQVSVGPDRQGLGIGRALVDHVARWAADTGIGALTLTTFTDVSWNRPLYEHIGFRVLPDDDIGPELRALRAAEAEHGLDPRIRVCMRRDVVAGASSRTCDLYARGVTTVVASWVEIARGAPGAAVRSFDGVEAAVFPGGPEREFYNNAVLDRTTDAGRPSAVDAMELAYATAGINRFAAWVHETDEATRADLVSRGYTLEETTRAMGMSLDDLADVAPIDPAIDIGPIPWADYLQYLRTLGLPRDLLVGTDPNAFHALGASRSGTIVATALAFDHERDCGVFNVSTLETARRQGIGTAVTGRLLLEARNRGCITATLQSTPMAERLYSAVGFRDLGRILEFQPAAR